MSEPSNRREIERLMKQEKRLPPGQSLTLRFPVLHYGPVPIYPGLDDWTFRIFGLVEEEKVWDWEAFHQLPHHKAKLDIHCVTRWSKFDGEWEGVHVRTLVDEGYISIKPEAKYCIQHCEYGYTTNIPTEVVLDDNFMLATHFNGEPLEPEHGYPLRGLMGAVPGRQSDTDRYLWKGGKWLRALEFVENDEPGFWENAGYSNSAKVWREERYWGSGT